MQQFNVKSYYANIARIAKQLAGVEDESWRDSDKEIWVTGVRDGAPGMVTTAVPALAAQVIEEKTHRLSEPHEIAKEKERRIQEGIRIRQEDREMKGRNAPDLAPEMKTLVEGISLLLQERQNNPNPRSKGAN